MKNDNSTKQSNASKPMLNDVFLGSYKDYIPLIEDKSLDLVITDPPYWLELVVVVAFTYPSGLLCL